MSRNVRPAVKLMPSSGSPGWIHVRALPAQDAVGEKQSAERQRVRAEEEPHPDLAEAGVAVMRIRRPVLVFITLQVMAVAVAVRAVAVRAAVLGRGILRGDSGCAHGAGFPLGSQPIRAPSLIRELSDGKSFFLVLERAVRADSASLREKDARGAVCYGHSYPLNRRGVHSLAEPSANRRDRRWPPKVHRPREPLALHACPATRRHASSATRGARKSSSSES